MLTLPRKSKAVFADLTPAWKPAVLSREQFRYLSSAARINYVASGRRSYKTQALKRRTVRAAIADQVHTDAQYFLCGPTYQQTKDIFWEDVKSLVPDWAFKRNRLNSISESELRIHLWNGAVIRLAGLDKPSRIEGGFWDGGGISEYGSCHPNIFPMHIRPMMIRGGWIDLEGVPEGQNHYYNEFKEAKKWQTFGATEEYAVHHWRTEDVLHLFLGKEAADSEIASAKALLDDRTYRQEYGAEFILQSGNVYYAFDVDVHGKKQVYRKDLPLIVCLDFNVAPGVAVVAQEQGGITRIIGEVYIRHDSNTPMVCRKIAHDWEAHKGDVKVYGDPAGGARTTKNDGGTDWDVVRNVLSPVFGQRLKILHAWTAPLQKTRINAVNSRLRSADGTIKLQIDPFRAPNTVEDFERTKVKEGTAGEIDKSIDDGKYSHLTDALGYYIAQVFPTRFVKTVKVGA